MNTKQIKQLLHKIENANKKRNIFRLKHRARKYDVFVNNGSILYNASLRLLSLIPTLQKIEKYSTKKYADYLKKQIREYGCYSDYKLLSKSIHLLPDDIILREEYLAIFANILKKLKAMEKNNNVNLR